MILLSVVLSWIRVTLGVHNIGGTFTIRIEGKDLNSHHCNRCTSSHHAYDLIILNYVAFHAFVNDSTMIISYGDREQHQKNIKYKKI